MDPPSSPRLPAPGPGGLANPAEGYNPSCAEHWRSGPGAKALPQWTHGSEPGVPSFRPVGTVPGFPGWGGARLLPCIALVRETRRARARSGAREVGSARLFDPTVPTGGDNGALGGGPPLPNGVPIGGAGCESAPLLWARPSASRFPPNHRK